MSRQNFGKISVGKCPSYLVWGKISFTEGCLGECQGGCLRCMSGSSCRITSLQVKVKVKVNVNLYSASS